MTDRPPPHPGVTCQQHHGQCQHNSSDSHCQKDQGHEGIHKCHACGLEFS